MVYTHFVELYIHDFVDLYGGEKNRRGVAEQYYKREVDWKEAGEERRDERAWILSDNISVRSESEALLVLSAISYIICGVLVQAHCSHLRSFSSLTIPPIVAAVIII